MYSVVPNTVSVTWSTFQPTRGRPPSVISGFLKANDSVTSPLWKSGTSPPVYAPAQDGASVVSAQAVADHPGPRAPSSCGIHRPRSGRCSDKNNKGPHFRGHRADFGTSQCRPPSHHGRLGAPRGIRVFRPARQETTAQAHLSQLDLHARRLLAAGGTAWTTLL